MRHVGGCLPLVSVVLLRCHSTVVHVASSVVIFNDSQAFTRRGATTVKPLGIIVLFVFNNYLNIKTLSNCV